MNKEMFLSQPRIWVNVLSFVKVLVLISFGNIAAIKNNFIWNNFFNSSKKNPPRMVSWVIANNCCTKRNTFFSGKWKNVYTIELIDRNSPIIVNQNNFKYGFDNLLLIKSEKSEISVITITIVPVSIIKLPNLILKFTPQYYPNFLITFPVKPPFF